MDLISAHCNSLKAGGLARRTVEAREYWLRYAEREMPFGVIEADRHELEAFLGHDGWARATRSKAFYHLNSFFEWGVDPANGQDGAILDDNPMAGMRRPKAPRGEPRPLTDAELRHVLANAREPYLTCVVLASGVGLRASELARQLRQHVNEEVIWVEEGKGGESASVPMQREVWEHVRDFPRGRLLAYVGGVADGRRLSALATNYFARTLDMPGVSLHRFRHTYARLLREGGADIATISRCLRHRHLSSTQVYARSTEAECRLAVNSLRLRGQTPI